ncbi:hypothetical protein D3C80_1190960 [compost metagenome]
MRNEIDLEFAGDHQLLGLRIGADMAGNHLLHQTGIDQLADADTGAGRIIGDHGQVLFALADQFVDQQWRGARAHETADHQYRAIRDLLDCSCDATYF